MALLRYYGALHPGILVDRAHVAIRAALSEGAGEGALAARAGALLGGAFRDRAERHVVVVGALPAPADLAADRQRDPLWREAVVADRDALGRRLLGGGRRVQRAGCQGGRRNSGGDAQEQQLCRTS